MGQNVLALTGKRRFAPEELIDYLSKKGPANAGKTAQKRHQFHGISFCPRLKLGVGQGNDPRTHKRQRKGETTMSTKNSNKLNIPEAREAMDKFKMEAAGDLDVPTPY